MSKALSFRGINSSRKVREITIRKLKTKKNNPKIKIKSAVRNPEMEFTDQRRKMEMAHPLVLAKKQPLVKHSIASV